ncbi:HotDog domain-containing protein [Chytriomyces sp. MP71]|nr:HotDog domain-containing protein [Chytriomyces sp. MP71]
MSRRNQGFGLTSLVATAILTATLSAGITVAFMHFLDSRGDDSRQEDEAQPANAYATQSLDQDSEPLIYIPPADLVAKMEQLPVVKRLVADPKVHVFPFRPVLIPEGGYPGEAEDLLAYTPGLNLVKGCQEEAPDLFAQHLLRGRSLYGPQRIEYAIQAFHPCDKTLVKIAKFGPNLCGHPGIVHGGMIAAFFDDAFGSIFFMDAEGRHSGVTANLTVNYRSPMLAPSTVAFALWIERVEGRKVFLRGEARSVPDVGADVSLQDERLRASDDTGKRLLGTNSVLFAEASALFIKLKPEQMVKILEKEK